jgi:hypothetical protein
MEPTGRLGIQPLDGPGADERLAALEESARYGSIHLALPDGVVLSRGWAVAALSSWLPGVRWLGRLTARVPSAGSGLERLYGVVADRRGALARFVPDVEPVDRPGEP